MSIKRILWGLAGMMMSVQLSAQGLTIGVVVPENEANIDKETCQILRNKIQQMMTRGGVSTVGGDIVCYPTVNISNQQTIEGGMRTLFTCDVDVTFTVIERFSKKMFASETFTLTGSGSRKVSEAVLNAVVSMQPGDRAYQNFVADTKQKVSNYYKANRAGMIAKARNLASMGQFEEALVVLYSYPSELEGADQVQTAMLSIYQQYEKKECTALIQQARGAIAQQDYTLALSYLVEVDADGACGDTANKLIKQIKGYIKDDVEKLEKQEALAADREYNLKQRELESVEKIVTSYYQRTWPTVNYNSVVGK